MPAQVWAVMWVMQYFSSLNGPHVVILFDSCYAAAIATAKATPRIHLRLAAILSGLVMALQEQTRVSFHHIKSHDGHPWNELADAGASAASTGLYSTPICTPPPASLNGLALIARPLRQVGPFYTTRVRKH